MKISWKWLQDYVLLDSSPERASRDLAMLGLPVDSVTPAGTDFALEIDVAANRPDCLSHVGVARELAALYGVGLRTPLVDPERVLPGGGAPPNVSVEARDLCSRYCGLAVGGARVGPSPPWLQERLAAVGQRPINNVVDITNYVLMEWGHPLHAFDLQKLEGGRVEVRRARDGEAIATLDGQSRSLGPDMLVIADASKPVALAGIMGGASSEVGEGTVDVLLESAWFQPLSVRKTARSLGICTEASSRFERGADLLCPPVALLRAAWLIRELGCGTPRGLVADVYPAPFEPRLIHVSRRRMDSLIGAHVPGHTFRDILSRLGFQVESSSGESWSVSPPSHRHDVTAEVDVIEEAARFYGYDRIPPTLPEMVGNPVHRPDSALKDLARRFFVGRGYFETTTSSFSDAASDSPLDGFQTGEALELDDPLDAGERAMRTNLAAKILHALKFNENNFNSDTRLFETGLVYDVWAGEVRERPRLAFGACGYETPAHFACGTGTPVGFFHVKGMVESLLRLAGVEKARFEPAGKLGFLQPGASATVHAGDRGVGFFGALDPRLADEMKFRNCVFVGELDMGALSEASCEWKGFVPVPRYPSVERDFSFLVDISVSYDTIVAAMEELKILELVRVGVLDVYKAADIPKGKSALTVRVVFRSPGGTLTDREADAFMDRVAGHLARRLGVQVR